MASGGRSGAGDESPSAPPDERVREGTDQSGARERAGEPTQPPATAGRAAAPGGGLGDFLRHQRELARLSIREMARRAGVSDSYLSQVERGLYRPSASVLKAVADALELSAASLYARAGLLDEEVSEPAPPPARPHSPVAPGGTGSAVERAIRADRRLSPAQREALVEVYRAMTAPGG